MVRPGYVKTDLTRNVSTENLSYKETSIDDVASTVLMTCTNLSLNGATIDVHGGLH